LWRLHWYFHLLLLRVLLPMPGQTCQASWKHPSSATMPSQTCSSGVAGVALLPVCCKNYIYYCDVEVFLLLLVPLDGGIILPATRSVVLVRPGNKNWSSSDVEDCLIFLHLVSLDGSWLFETI
jgi:hypothetical protein